MADALCGPSNALQSFQKHNSVDRTLQQDRLALRQSPTQGFRSSQPDTGILDAEFEAFQAGHPFAAGLPTFQQPQRNGPAVSSGHEFPHPQLPDWALDFQGLHLGEARSSPIPQSQFRQEAPLQRNLPGGWHQDFMRQQGRQTTRQQPVQQTNGFGSRMYQNRGFPMVDGTSNQLSPMAQMKQPQQEDVFDEEAFERAFRAAKEEVDQVQEQQEHTDTPYIVDEQALRDYHVKLMLGEQQKEKYAFDEQRLRDYQTQLLLIEQQNKRKLLKRRQEWEMAQKQQADVELGNDVLVNESADLLTRSDHLVEQEIIGSDRIFHRDEDQRADTRSHDEADDLARTAGQLLDSVRHDQSQKFQDSSFLALMRQLRDREVRIEGDSLVDVSTSSSPNGPKHYHNGPAEMITCRVLGCERVDD